MGLEQEIKQSTFRNLYQKGLVNLLFTYNHVNEQLKVIFDKENITSQQFNILRILRGAGKPLSTLEIRERMLDRMSDTSRIVDRLVLKMLVQKSTRPEDKRLVNVSITDKGKRLLVKFDKREAQIDAVIGNLTLAEIKTLNKLLDKIRDNDVENNEK